MRWLQCHMFSLFISGLTRLFVLLFEQFYFGDNTFFIIIFFFIISFLTGGGILLFIMSCILSPVFLCTGLITDSLQCLMEQFFLGGKHFWSSCNGYFNSSFILKLVVVILQQEFWQDLADSETTVHLEPYLPVKLCGAFLLAWLTGHGEVIDVESLYGVAPLLVTANRMHQLVWVVTSFFTLCIASTASECDASMCSITFVMFDLTSDVNISLGNSAMMSASDGVYIKLLRHALIATTCFCALTRMEILAFIILDCHQNHLHSIFGFSSLKLQKMTV